MKKLIKWLSFSAIAISSLGMLETVNAARVTYDSTKYKYKTRPVRRRVVYERGSRAGDVLAPAATGALIGGIAGGGRGAGIGAGVGLGLGLLNSRPRYREVVYEYDEPEIIDDEDIEESGG